MSRAVKIPLVCALMVVLALVITAERAPTCDSDCKLPDCRCSSLDIPGLLAPSETPQFVILTFDDAVTVSNIEFYRRSFSDRLNPNKCPVSATFFVSHEYSDYHLVHELYAKGHEIALHSISHSANTSYWRTATVDQLAGEFSGQRELVSTFANIPKEEIRGVRLPFLQMSGETSFQMLANEGFVYDYSWPTIHYRAPGMWPYSLDYASKQDCVIGPCPVDSYPKVWVMPMVSWIDEDFVFCSMVDTCVNIPESVEDLTEFMINNFKQHYYSNKAPFGFYVHAAWFVSQENAFQAYLNFLDYLQGLDDVIITTASQVLDWVRNPIPVTDLINQSQCKVPVKTTCAPRTCQLTKEVGSQVRWMTSCAQACPRVYPWIDNPLGI